MSLGSSDILCYCFFQLRSNTKNDLINLDGRINDKFIVAQSILISYHNYS